MPARPLATRSARVKASRADRLVACDANIRVKAATTMCPFADNVFYTYYAASHDTGPVQDEDEADSGVGRNIPNYDNGTGYRVQCADGMYSQSGGRPSACSGHGGVG